MLIRSYWQGGRGAWQRGNRVLWRANWRRRAGCKPMAGRGLIGRGGWLWRGRRVTR